MIFIETSVLIASCQDFHEDHTRSFDLVASLTPSTASTAVHCLTEMFAVLTRLPARYRVSPISGFALVGQMRGTLSIVDLSSNETFRAMEAIVGQGLSGGMIYDALIVACARKAKARSIYTLNKRHFDRVAPDLAECIALP